MKIKIPKKTTWNLSPLLKGDNDRTIEAKVMRAERKNRRFIAKWKRRTDYLKDPRALRKALDELEEIGRTCGRLGGPEWYFGLRLAQEQDNPKLKAISNKLEEREKKISNEQEFFFLNIAKIPASRQRKLLATPALATYRHYLEETFALGKHLLSEPEEKIMTLKSKSAHDSWIQLTRQLISREERTVLGEDGKRGKKGFSSIMTLIDSQRRQVRDLAAKAINEILLKHARVAEAEMNAILGNKKVNDELRRYSRPDFARHLGDDMATEAVDALVQSVSKRFDIPRRFYRLKARLLRLKQLRYHERNVPYGNLDMRYSYRDAVSLVSRVFDRLDSELGSIFKTMVERGQFDIYPRTGKRDGAFCASNLPNQPTYILLNYGNKLRDVTTIAHEMGHAIHWEFSKRAQNSLHAGVPISTTEVASTFMEDFVLEEISQGADDKSRLAILLDKLNDDVSTVFRQVACYNFEAELHREFRAKGYLSKAEIGKIFLKHMRSYMGDSVEQSPGSENWWVYWSHIRSFFYVYSYANGLLISKHLQNEVRRNPKFVSRIKEFFSTGSSRSPRDIFLKLGVDITQKKFWERAVQKVETSLHEVELLAKKLGKI